MRRLYERPKYLALTAALLILLQVMAPVGFSEPAWALPFTDLPQVTGPMLEAGYWIDKMSDPDRILLTPGQIDAFNQAVYQETADDILPVYDLASFPDMISGEQLQAFMAVEIGDYPLYMAGATTELNRSVLDQALSNMGSDKVNRANPVSYAVAVARCSMKALPLAEVISDTPGDYEYDEFQSSVVLPAEPVLILYASQDGNWQFIQSYNCYGWVESRFLARASHQQWLDYVSARDARFLMIAGNRVVLNENPYDPALSELELPMATRIPLADPTQIPDLIDGQNPSGNWVVSLPVRTSTGSLENKLALIPGSADALESYLPYTSANIIRQAFKTMGDRYGWGGMLNGRDCSELVMDIFACFGLDLPRNTTGQSGLHTGAVMDLDGYSDVYRSQLLKNLRPGAALYFPGHTMIYLGEENNRHYVISALGSYANIDPKGNADIQRVHGTVVNDLSVKRRNGHTWLSELTVACQYFGFHYNDIENSSDRAAIEALANSFVVSGTAPGEFSPEGWLSRGELAQLLMRASKLEPAPEAAAFQDIGGHWSQGAVGAMVKAGLMNGVYADYFQPDGTVTRGELAAILARCVGDSDSLEAIDAIKASQLCTDFADVPEWAKKGVYWCLEAGFVKTRADGTFAPADPATRGEAAAAVYRAGL